MTRARTIIRDALTFGLNRLSPGEQEDADLFGRCLDALNYILDKWNGSKGLLWREFFTDSVPITGLTGTLGATWPGLLPGDEIIGASVRYSPGLDQPMSPLTMGQYQEIALKNLQGAFPQQYAHDGAATVYLYPAANSHVITLLTKQAASLFTDLDTEFVMPQGYASAFTDQLAEVMAPTLNPQMLQIAATKAAASRRRIGAQAISPEIISSTNSPGRLAAFLAG
jgi:hypothetical protein